MGCIGLTNLDEGEKTPIFKAINENVHSLKDFKIGGGMFIQTINENPFNDYEKTRVIGEGTFGTVYRIIHKQSKLIRAIKVLDMEKMGQAVESQNFLNEINFVKSLDHPNINKIYEIYNHDKKISIVSEICTGGELFDLIKTKNRLKEKEAAQIMKQIFSAISFYQSYGIVHCDIKPENILIESSADLTKGKINCKIIDFGLSHCSSESTSNKSNVTGTISYLAPECFDGHSSCKRDVWAAGAILYNMLEGKLPFRGESNKELIESIKRMKYEFITDVSEPAKDLMKCIFTNHKKRISASDALAHHFIVNNTKNVESRPSMPINKISTAINNMKEFKVDKKLQHIVLGFIVHSMSESDHIKELKDLFMEFDTSGDGRLTIEELTECFAKTMSKEQAQKEVGRIIAYLDTDSSGYIEMQEFVRASADMKVLLTTENLNYVFSIFDKDKNGRISPSEIAEVIAPHAGIEIEVCKQMLEEVELNDAGELTFRKFKEMMLKILEC